MEVAKTSKPEPYGAGVVKWVEKAAIANMCARTETATYLVTQASATLTVLLAGIGGSMAYAAKIFDPQPGPVGPAAAWLCGYLSLLAVLLVVKCLMVRGFPNAYNEPAHLLHRGYELDLLREVELDNLQTAIGRAFDRNALVSRWLNFVRLAAALSPVVLALALLYYR